MRLYDLDLSGNCYKVRLFAALTGTPLTCVPVDLAAAEHHTARFAMLNPFEEVPVLVDGTTVLRDSQAILVYLAGRLKDRSWWPDNSDGQAEIVQWLSVATSEIRDGPNAARLIRKFGAELSMERALGVTNRLLPLLDRHLASRDWFALDRPTLADCALFPYLALAHKGGIDIAPFPALVAWTRRIHALPGFIPMPGLSERSNGASR